MDLQRLMSFYQTGRQSGGFEKGIQTALQRILARPKFVFHIEAEPAGTAPDGAYPISDLELASRLSFFLWSSIPDDELLQVAGKDPLHTSTVLEQKGRRTLAEPIADALGTSDAHRR